MCMKKVSKCAVRNFCMKHFLLKIMNSNDAHVARILWVVSGIRGKQMMHSF